MSSRNFRELLEKRWSLGYFVCVGLDSDLGKIPKAAHDEASSPWKTEVKVKETLVAFNRAIVDATSHLVCAYKPNSAFYEQHGAKGTEALRETIAYIHQRAPDVPVILDAKRADIGNTNKGYVDATFDLLGADAITVHPYLGKEALQPFLSRTDKGVIVLCRTSNPGAGEFQDLETNGEPLYKVVARRVAEDWNTASNCALVVGATYPDELAEVRQLVGDIPILIPGIGAQGGDVQKTVTAGKDSRRQGMIINSSRGIIFASSERDYADVARKKTEELHNLINQFRNE